MAEQIGRLFSQIQVEALSGQDVREKQATLRRAQEELRLLHARQIADAAAQPAKIGLTFRQKWDALDAAGRNEFLRSAKVRVVVSRSELPPVDHQDQPPAPHGIPSMVIVDKPELHAVIYLGSLADLLSPLTKARQET